MYLLKRSFKSIVPRVHRQKFEATQAATQVVNEVKGIEIGNAGAPPAEMQYFQKVKKEKETAQVSIDSASVGRESNNLFQTHPVAIPEQPFTSAMGMMGA